MDVGKFGRIALTTRGLNCFKLQDTAPCRLNPQLWLAVCLYVSSLAAAGMCVCHFRQLISVSPQLGKPEKIKASSIKLV